MSRFNLFSDVLDRLHTADGLSSRRAIMQEHHDNPLIRRFFRTVFHPLDTLGVSVKQPESAGDYTEIARDAAWDRLCETMDLCVARKLSGNAAKDQLTACISSFDDRTAGWLTKMVNRTAPDKCGYGLAAQFYPEMFPCTIVQKCRGAHEAVNEGEWYAEPKWDGMRLWMFWDDTLQSYRVLSYNLVDKNVNNFRFVIDELERTQLLDHDHVIDFEVWSRDWQKSISLAQTKSDLSDEDAMDIRAAVFDRVNKKSFFETGEDPTPARERIAPIRALYPEMQAGEFAHIIIPENIDISGGLDGAWAIAEQMYDMTIGIEGMVAKRYDAPYGDKHSDLWIKFKYYETHDYPIRMVNEGSGRNAGMAGSVNLLAYEDKEDETKSVFTNSGSGMDLTVAQELWARREEIAEMWERGTPYYAEVKHLGVFPGGALREPIFQRLRTDKHKY